MTDEPYRWLEAIQNRREYVESRLKGGSPVFALSLSQGLLLFGLGTGQSKVFEIHDRHGLAGLGHPADLERIRQAVIDAAHLEAFTRATDDVSLRRLVSFGLGPQLKAAYEQIYAPPFIARLVLAEVAPDAQSDVLLRLDFDGTFAQATRVAVVADLPTTGTFLESWLLQQVHPDLSVPDAAALCLRAAIHAADMKESANPPDLSATLPAIPPGRRIEAALLQRQSPRTARYLPLSSTDLGLPHLAPR
ncbi:MAG: hypothetical protein JNK85_14530 [Verrucomicrobiales bacterium]|nr:hypothetical protein [Verrucomicrobiales bacterium]